MTTALTLGATGVLAAGVLPTHAENRPTPGNITGYAFDRCVTPTQREMDRWLTSSPYWAIGIYISGGSRACWAQPNLTRSWVTNQLANGWRLLPLTVGPQASCTAVPGYRKERISPDSTDRYARARAQGRREAGAAVAAARGLGIVADSTLWYDLEHFNSSISSCRVSALSFLSSWTNRLHALGYQSGVYASASSGIKVLDDAKTRQPTRFAMPDSIWIAHWNGVASVASSWVRPRSWMPHRRVHQYRGDHWESYGGVSLNIDSNYLDLGQGSVARPRPQLCGGVQVDFPRYLTQQRAVRGPQVRALQCQLHRKGFLADRPTGAFGTETETAVRAFQRAHALPVSGLVGARTWTTLLSEGPSPVVKIGSSRPAVRRLQRALNASTTSRLPVTGLFGPRTTKAVKAYQHQIRMHASGVVATRTWDALHAGRLR